MTGVQTCALPISLRVDPETAEDYVPFGCGEFVISGQSIGTPNVLLNLLKILNISLNGGIDPWDGKDKSGGLALLPPENMDTFDDVWKQYAALLDDYVERTAKAHRYSYDFMNRRMKFLFTSLLISDCVARGKAVLDGGAGYLGGTLETYGNINAADSLAAVKYWEIGRASCRERVSSPV